MTIAAAFHYDQGKRIREVALEETIPSNGARSSFAWIGLIDPDDAEMATLAKTITSIRSPSQTHSIASALPSSTSTIASSSSSRARPSSQANVSAME